MFAKKALEKVQGVTSDLEWKKSKIEDKFYIDPELGERIIREKEARSQLK